MRNEYIFEWDDFGTDHVISDACQTHDCRDALQGLKNANPRFKATLFAVPGEMTVELLNWTARNADWVELAVHGLFHSSNYECEKISYRQFDLYMDDFDRMGILDYFVRGFRAPGWQISDGVYEWLAEHEWWVADQSYNNDRRPKHLRSYTNTDGKFSVIEQYEPTVSLPNVWHGHTWNCMGNGIYETYERLLPLVTKTNDYAFVSEVM